MKKIVLAVLIILLLALTFPNIPKVSATTTEDHAPGLPADVPREPTSDSPSGDYLNTTNPYADIGSEGATAEAGVEEGDKPIYVLVFGDEEERGTVRYLGPDQWFFWDGYARLQLERGDEALVANFGIDIRILGFLEWDSDDSLDTMTKLWYELESDTEQYLGQWYNSDYVEAIIGITSQVDPYPHAGKSPPPEYLNQGRTFTLLNWQVYWADDNLVQHEVSHLFYADDHPEYQNEPCCAMAGHTHYQDYIWEDGMWLVFNDVPCGYTSYDWCGVCQDYINAHKDWPAGYQLSIFSPGSTGTTDPSPGSYVYRLGTSVTVTAFAYSGYTFDYWLLDGAKLYGYPITVTMDSDHTLEAYFRYLGVGGGGGGGGGKPPVCVPYWQR